MSLCTQTHTYSHKHLSPTYSPEQMKPRLSAGDAKKQRFIKMRRQVDGLRTQLANIGADKSI